MRPILRSLVAAGSGLLLVALAACEALVRPTREARIASAEAGEAHFAGRMDRLRRSVFFTLSSDSAQEPDVAAREGRFTITPHGGAWVSALASGITRDGYLMTAAHVLRRHNWAVGWMDGALGIRPARVVERRDYGAVGAEFAILRVEAAVDSPLPLMAREGFAGDIYVMAAERGGGHGIECLAGRVLGYSTALGASACFVVRADLPTRHGDSGGPVLSSDGQLIGVDVGWEMPAFSGPVRTLCCPNPAVVLSIIEGDRRSHPWPGTGGAHDAVALPGGAPSMRGAETRHAIDP